MFPVINAGSVNPTAVCFIGEIQSNMALNEMDIFPERYSQKGISTCVGASVSVKKRGSVRTIQPRMATD